MKTKQRLDEARLRFCMHKDDSRHSNDVEKNESTELAVKFPVIVTNFSQYKIGDRDSDETKSLSSMRLAVKGPEIVKDFSSKTTLAIRSRTYMKEERGQDLWLHKQQK
jgi:hypothetical protein